MTSAKRWTRARTAAVGLAAGMILTISGDRGAFTAPPPGIDPLDILNLQIRANAIVVLDSSGSMQETLGAGDLAGDDYNAKMYQAKQVLAQVMKDNERKVSFQFGQYEQPGIGAQNGTPLTIPTTGTERFLYTTDSLASPSLLTNELNVDLRSYVIPNGASLRLIEGAGSVSAVVPAARYATGVALANALATAASNAGSGGNTYTVTYLDNHRFRFTRATGSLSFSLRWSAMGAGGDLALRQEIGGSTTDQAATGTPLSATTANNSGGDIDLRRRGDADFFEALTTCANAPTGTPAGCTFYRAYARRFFNGQTLVLRQSSTATAIGTPPTAPAALFDGDIVCSMTPALGTTGVGGTGALADVNNPLSFRDQPWVDLVRGDANCNPATGSNAQTVRLRFASVPRGNYNDTYVPGSGEWRTWGATTTCGGFESLVDLQPCTENAQFNLMSPHLQPEIAMDPGTRWPIGYSEDVDGNLPNAAAQPDRAGLRAAGNTPIAEAIADVDTVFTNTLWPTISSYGGGSGPFPKTFLIFLTDGDDTCETENGGSALSDDNRALRAAYRAQLLYQSVDASNVPRAVASSVTTFVVAFGNGASAARSNWIAWGGSSMTRPTFNEGGAIGLRWATAPTLADRANCKACRDAFVASTAAELTNALRIAIDQGQTVGIFSDQQSVTESIFELAYLAPQPPDPDDSIDPWKPATRFNSTLPVLLQSTFEMPNFEGHLKAFRRGGTSTIEEWDAGVKLNDRLTADMAGSNWSFSELRGGSTTTEATIGSSTAKIKRRIFSSPRNGVFDIGVDDVLATPPVNPGRVTIWPPESSVDPAGVSGTYADGILDNALGIGPLSNPLLTFADLGTTFGACTSAIPADLPADCTAASGRGRREAREIILASMAGADLVTSGNLALRRPADKELLFRQRSWALGESTLAAPAVAGPPSAEAPQKHRGEYDLYIKGPRDASAGNVAINAIAQGFGLRTPDDDGTTDPEDKDTRTLLKPVMSVVYHAANDMLHAFRAGPCRSLSGSNACNDGRTETGGEELWGYVPYDVLGALKDRRSDQKRDPHTYMMASPVRLTDVFVPGRFNDTSLQVSGEGVWRTYIFFGRGIGGKYLTALDVTAPGPFTKSTYQAAGPIVVWSRGNPDTQNGLVGGTANNSTPGNNDLVLYEDMGQTWSVPAIGNVEPANNTTPRKPDPTTDPVEFVAYVGSGYGDTTGCASSARPCEGKRFYTLDALTGDIVASFDVGDRAGSSNPFPNALVAAPAAFNAARLSNVNVDVNVAADLTTRVYINDIHGRVHRMMTDAPGTAVMLADVNDTASTVLQPLGTAPALINSGDLGDTLKPHIYVESGHDNRIFPPDASPATTPPFRLVALQDDDLSSDPSSTDGVAGPVTVLFTKDLDNLYRGSAQPATAFAQNGNARVFFAATRFNPPGTTFAPPPPPCRSSFDSIVFALGALTGNAAYDLNATGTDEFVEYRGEKVQAIQVVRGRLILDRALGAEIAPEPPAPTTIGGTPDDQSVFLGSSVPLQWSVTNRSAFQSGTSVCRN